MRRINQQYGIKGVTILNDNDSQFIANNVKLYLKASEANREFTHIATPEENAYIEAFHSIVQREAIDRFEFDSFYHAKHTLAAHRNWYGNRRLQRSIGMTPSKSVVEKAKDVKKPVGQGFWWLLLLTLVVGAGIWWVKRPHSLRPDYSKSPG